jgi:hypothetical protein
LWVGDFGSSGYGNWVRKLVFTLMNSGKYIVQVKSVYGNLRSDDPLFNLEKSIKEAKSFRNYDEIREELKSKGKI